MGKKNAQSVPKLQKKRGALQYRQGMTAFPPPPAGQGGVMVLVRNRPPPLKKYKKCNFLPLKIVIFHVILKRSGVFLQLQSFAINRVSFVLQKNMFFV